MIEVFRILNIDEHLILRPPTRRQKHAGGVAEYRSSEGKTVKAGRPVRRGGQTVLAPQTLILRKKRGI